MQGHLHTYRFCDNVWTFILQDASFKQDGVTKEVDLVKIVACDAKFKVWRVSIAPPTYLSRNLSFYTNLYGIQPTEIQVKQTMC